MHRITITIEKEDAEKLEKISKRMDRNISDTIRHLIREEVKFN